MQVPHRAPVVLAFLALLAAGISPAAAQSRTLTQSFGVLGERGEVVITPLVQEGDVVTGVGTVTSVSNFAVNNSGGWIVEAATDAVSTANDVLIKDGVLYLTEGQILAEPVGAGINTFDTVNLNNLGNSGWNFFLENTSGTSDDSGMYWNTTLLFQESTASTASGLTPGTPYIGFFEAKINDANDILLIATVDDPAIASTVDQVLMQLCVDGSGNLVSETLLAAEGQIPDGQTETIAVFGTGPLNFDQNANGVAMYLVDLNGSTATDIAVYRGTTLVAQEGSPSPAVGRNWLLSSSTTAVALNDGGSYALRGGLDGDAASNTLIVRDGVPVVQEGDSLPEIAPFVLTNLGTGPVYLGNNGGVLWFGQWDDPDTTRNKALFVNDEILVQEGVTRIDGKLVDTLRGITDGYAMSDNGVYVVFEAVLQDGTEGAYLARRKYVTRQTTL